jgi:hypothetical protein
MLVIISSHPCLEGMPTDNLVGVVYVGTVSVDFTNVDMSGFRKRMSVGRLEYELAYQIDVDFRSDEGVLRCFCMADGKTIGVTTISFTDLAG